MDFSEQAIPVDPKAKPSSMVKLFKTVLAAVLILWGSVCWSAFCTAAPFAIKGKARIQDQAGRRISVKKPFERIISLYGAHTENLFALGLADRIIGVSHHEVYPPPALKKPAFSYREGPEKFLAARPDLVLIRPMIERGYSKLIRRLEQSGITVVSIQPGTVEEIFCYWRILGILSGKTDQAERMVSLFEDAVADFEALTRDIADKKRVYFEAIHSKMKTFPPDSMAMFALRTAGGINLADDARPVRKGARIAAYGKERILSHAGEIELFLAQSGLMNPIRAEDIRNEPGFGVIEAVKAGDIHIINERLVSRPTPRLLWGIAEIGRALYPKRFNPDQLEAILGPTARLLAYPPTPRSESNGLFSE